MTSVIMLGTRRCLCPWALPSALLLLLHALVAAALHAPQGPATAQRWGMLQLNLTGPAAGATGAANPFVDVGDARRSFPHPADLPPNSLHS